MVNDLASGRITENVLGNPIDVAGWEEVQTKILYWAEKRESRYVCICNVHSVVSGYLYSNVRHALRRADMCTPDGAPVAWTLRAAGHKAQPRIDGPDLMWKLCELSAQLGLSIYLYGGSVRTLERLKTRLRTEFPGLLIAGSHSPPYRAITAEEDELDVRDIQASGASIVWVALGCPKQELWMAAHCNRIQSVLIGVGAAFDFHAGAARRAPVWVRSSGFEWLHRLLADPRRLFVRYAVTNLVFIVHTAAWVIRRAFSKFRWLDDLVQ